MIRLYRTLFFMLSVCIVNLSFGQSTGNTPISGNFTNLSFRQFAEAIEAHTDYRFYFNPTDVDSLQVQLQVTDKPLVFILNQIFDGKPLRFAIDNRNRVFITANQAIQTSLPIGFFERGTGGAADDTTNIDYGAVREKARLSLETKLFEIGSRGGASRTGNATLAGRIRSTATGEPAIGVYVLIDKPRIGVLTDQYGSYSISLPRGRHELQIRSIGMSDTKRQIMLYGDGKLDIEMDEEVVPLREVIVGAKKDVNVAGLQMGAERLDIRTIKQVPTVLGEADLIRVVLTIPGVKSVGEGTV
ncbi:MAG TPA: carboxypeptidase-like regulatory domain-containing protein, partial [Fibrella sp.]